MAKTIIFSDISKLAYINDNYDICNISDNKLKQIKGQGCYSRCIINKVTYQYHRIVYVLYNKVDLTKNEIIDHIDRNPANNHPLNLRIVTHQENIFNSSTHKNNKIGIKNISNWTSEKGEEYYRISIGSNVRNFHGRYKKSEYTLEEVIKMRDTQISLIHGKHGSYDIR